MSLLVPCPDCGLREFTEFSYGGETNARPAPAAPPEALADYLFVRRNSAGTQQEWWYHRYGCRSWFLARRDTVTNRFLDSYWPEDARRVR
ncbi:MAG TPA: sarcosine oxidase subunit delta [Patescibacteria group bacterium]|nr:sarcosine oxidase subunit delta [Patescibacteria group bacterium]